VKDMSFTVEVKQYWTWRA